MITRAALVLAAALLAAAPGASAAGSSDLTGKVWRLTELGGKAPLRGTNPTMEFANGKVTGSTGCNDFAAAYTARLITLRIEHPVATTLKACAAPVEEQERSFLSMLASVRLYGAGKGTLTLRAKRGKLLATFEAVTQDLAGTSWRVLAYNNGKSAVTSVLEKTHLTADFSRDGHVTGRGGCNTFGATYEASPPKISFGPIAETRKNCSTPESVMTQEAAYLAALQSAATYTTDGAKLTLKNASGATAVELVRR